MEGALVSRRDRDAEGLVVELTEGQCVTLPWTHARLVQVEPVTTTPRRPLEKMSERG